MTSFLFVARNYKLEAIVPPQTFAAIVKLLKRLFDVTLDTSTEISSGKHEREPFLRTPVEPYIWSETFVFECRAFRFREAFVGGWRKDFEHIW